MRYDEEICRCAVDLLLREHGFQPEWIDGTEPPDYFLTINMRRFAVEMTSIHGFTKLNRKNHTWTQLGKGLLSFGDEVCREVESKVIISGCYIINLPSMPKLKKWRKDVVQSLVTYFEQYAYRMAEMAQEVILRPERRAITLWKVGKEGSALIVQALPTGAFITHREDQLSDLLGTVIRTKAHKLLAVIEPCVLVVLDQYGFQCGIGEWRKCLPTESSHFEAVIRVHRNKAELVTGGFEIG